MSVDVRYLVNDVATSRSFYEEHLGFSTEEDWGGPFVMLARGELRLWLSGPGSSAARPMPDGRSPSPGGWNRFVIEVDDIASVVERLRARGVSARSDVVCGPGGAQCVIDDPDGNPIELFQPA